MAFTDDERSQIRGYLGYGDHSIATIDVVNSRLDILLPETETIVRVLLSRIANVDSSLTSGGVDTAGIQGAGKGDILFYEGAKISELRGIGRTLCNQLSIKCGLDILADYFGVGSDEDCALDGLINGFF